MNQPSLEFEITLDDTTYKGFLCPCDIRRPPLAFNVVTTTDQTVGRFFYGKDETWHLESDVNKYPEKLCDFFQEAVRNLYD